MSEKFFNKFRYSNRNTNIFLICILLVIIVFLTFGYSILNGIFKIKGNLVINSFNDISITDVESSKINKNFEINYRKTHNMLLIEGNLPDKKDQLIYEVTISNVGTNDIKIKNIDFNADNNNIY